MLHIVDGSCAEEVLIKNGLEGSFLEWGDVLHDGPFCNEMVPEEAASFRGAFLEERFQLDKGEATSQLFDRNRIIREAVSRKEEIVIWGSEELFDQLIVLECIWLLVNYNAYPENVYLINFSGSIGSNSDTSVIHGAFKSRSSLESKHFNTAVKIWDNYRKGDFNALFEEEMTLFPFMRRALRRVLQEIPDIHSGLSRTERQILETLSRSHLTGGELFLLCHELEEVPFMGDLSFFIIIEQLSADPSPLIITEAGGSYTRGIRDKLTVTETGEKVLNGEVNILDIREINRWVGGMHISSAAE